MVGVGKMAIVIDSTKNVLLIDTSYFIFYRYFAVFNWYKLSQKNEIDVPNILNDVAFMEKYTKLFKDNIKKLTKKYDISLENVVFVKDCCRENIWRYKHYEAYKKTRDDKLRTFNGDIFKYSYGTLLPAIVAEMGVQMCEYDTAEADDIIAIFAQKLYMETDVNITIITNDNDYVQLANERVKLMNLKGVDLTLRAKHSPQTYLELKIILGDKSDNIPAVFDKCGEKKALIYAENNEELLKKLSANSVWKQRYDLNKLLIDFKMIPEDIRQNVNDMLNMKPI
jgi:5'-3' exonuclease